MVKEKIKVTCPKCKKDFWLETEATADGDEFIYRCEHCGKMGSGIIAISL